MNVNKIAVTAKNHLDDFISKKFGIILKVGKPKVKPEQIGYSEQNFNSYGKNLKKALIEAEINENQAIEYLRRIQNR